jgi:hypothetical protein
LEGLTQPGIPVIEVRDPLQGKELKARPADLAAVVGATDPTLSCPCFKANDIQGIGAFMEAYHER